MGNRIIRFAEFNGFRLYKRCQICDGLKRWFVMHETQPQFYKDFRTIVSARKYFNEISGVTNGN